MNPFAWLQAVPIPVAMAISALTRLVWDLAAARGDAARVESALMQAAEDSKAALDAHRFGQG